MSSVKTATRYSRLVDICTGFGGKYNPGRQTLQLNAMRALLNEAQSSLQDVSQKKIAYDLRSNEREAGFADVGRLSSKVVYTMKALAMTEATIDDARFYLRLITGRRKSQRPPLASAETEEKPTGGYHGYQQSYAAIAHNFRALVIRAANQPGYVTNEPEISIESLQAKVDLLESLNTRVHEAKVSWMLAITHRNDLMYRREVSVVNNARRVKSYLRVLYGPNSAEYAQARELSFTKPRIR